MANDKLMTYDQGESIKTTLGTIATNITNINKNIELPSNKVTSMLGYTKGSDTSAIGTSDTLNAAIGKLEKRTDNNTTNISLLADSTKKNYLNFNNTSTDSTNGVVYTVNSDNTITADVSGKTGMSYVLLLLGTTSVNVSSLCNGNYILSGCPTGGGTDTFQMYAAGGTYVKRDFGDGVELSNTDITGIYVLLRIEAGYTGGNITFKPMIRIKGANSDYQPYAMTNAEITAWIQAHT